MKPAAFQYHAPTTVGAAVDLMAELGDGAKVLAGGQSLIPMLGQEAGRAALSDLASVPADLHGTADYRKRVGAVMVARALATAIREAGGDGE